MPVYQNEPEKNTNRERKEDRKKGGKTKKENQEGMIVFTFLIFYFTMQTVITVCYKAMKENHLRHTQGDKNLQRANEK